MAAGYQPGSKQELDSMFGSAVVNFREAMETIQRIQTWLTEYYAEGGADLLLQHQYSTADTELIRASFAAMNKAVAVTKGQDIVPVADDHMYHARKLAGMR